MNFKLNLGGLIGAAIGGGLPWLLLLFGDYLDQIPQLFIAGIVAGAFLGNTLRALFLKPEQPEPPRKRRRRREDEESEQD